jgi:hypothetical protein
MGRSGVDVHELCRRFWSYLGLAEAVSKLGALEGGTCCRFGEARRLTVFGGANKLNRKSVKRRALTAKTT